MSVGCRHNPELACDLCLKAFEGNQALIIDTDLRPNPEEELEQFQKRVQAAKTLEAVSGDEIVLRPAGYVEPSLEEQKRIIKDPNVPEAIRRYWRTRMYGQGGSGRKGVQQERLQRLNVIEGQRVTGPSVVSKELSGRQRKRSRRLLRKLAKVASEAK